MTFEKSALGSYGARMPDIGAPRIKGGVALRTAELA